jgi:SAM-dependent methyltransferase
MTAATPTQSYDPIHFARLAAIEERHAWFRARRDLIGRLAAELTRDLPDGFRVLEVGCGTGLLLQELERVCPRGQVIGMDLYAEGLRFARQRTKCQLVLGDANNPPFGAEFDLVGLFDVLEHLPDDKGVLRRMRELLLPSGALLLTVPADPTLWSSFDEAACHARRYELPDLERKLTEAGFQVTYITHFMRALAPVLRTIRRGAVWSRGSRGAERELRVVPVINDVLYWILKQEATIIGQRRQIRTGTSILAIARRPPDGASVLDNRPCQDGSVQGHLRINFEGESQNR